MHMVPTSYHNVFLVPWQISDSEWQTLGSLLVSRVSPERARGRPRLSNDRLAAQACLYRYFHSHGERYRAFGWARLPARLGMSPATANRRFRQWNASGAWAHFHRELMQQRMRWLSSGTSQAPSLKKLRPRMSTIVAELERAFEYFNAYFCGNALTNDVTVTIG